MCDLLALRAWPQNHGVTHVGMEASGVYWKPPAAIAIVRNTAGGIPLFAGIFFVLPPLMNILPLSWNNAIGKWLPSEAGRQLFALHRDPRRLAQWPSGGLFLGYCVIATVIAAVLLPRRDT